MADLHAFVLDTGHDKSSRMKVSAADVYQSLACRVWIHGEQKQAGNTVKPSFKSLEFLQERSPERLNGFSKDLSDFLQVLHHWIPNHQPSLHQCFDSAQ